MSKSINVQSSNAVTITGKLNDVVVREGTSKNGGKPYRAGTVTIRVEQTYGGKSEISEIPVQFIAMKFSTTLSEFSFVEKDVVDLAVRIDKNEFRGEVKASVQIRDMRFSGIDEENLFKSQALYEKYRRGDSLTPHEARFLTPTREFLLGVYGLLKQYKVWQYDIEVLTYRAKCPIERYCTMLVSIDVLCELGLLKRENGQLIFDGEGKKADLSQSKILNDLNRIQGGEQ